MGPFFQHLRNSSLDKIYIHLEMTESKNWDTIMYFQMYTESEIELDIFF